MSYHGNPCWYELGTNDLEAAGQFYEKILDWQVEDSGMEGFQYHLASSDGDKVAGLMSNAGQAGSPPPNWLIYFAVDDCDRTAAHIGAAGGKILKAPDDIPGTGRYCIAADPQGAVFGLLQPDMSGMSDEARARADAGEGAFNPNKAGHGNWNELMSSDPQAGFDFYSGLFGWSKGQAMDMGPMGTYQLFQRKQADIGAMMGLGDSPASAWLPYFGAKGSVTGSVEAIRASGGQVHHGPSEVPGPRYIVVARDPQGAWFALVGEEE